MLDAVDAVLEPYHRASMGSGRIGLGVLRAALRAADASLGAKGRWSRSRWAAEDAACQQRMVSGAEGMLRRAFTGLHGRAGGCSVGR